MVLAETERRRAYKASWYKSNTLRSKEITRDARFRKLYSITIRDYDALLKAQGGHCALCQEKPGKRRLHVDHNHKTGKVRGLLCLRCNIALERVESVTRWAQGALLYIGEG